jgi:eukaryotic-like serine/threonine-protein kinase
VGTQIAGNGRVMLGELIADRYELEELVGSGGMSSVYKAKDTLLERNVALKILHAHYTGDEEYVQRFRHEARAVAQLSHPNIVTVIDRGEENGRQFIVFEYVHGENLKELIDRTGPLPVRRAVELSLEIARGLAFAHAQGLVHRDVKPQNVLLNGDGEAKVTDFGIARSLDVEHGMTQTGTVLGTSNYIAPEQASGRHVNELTDVYSLGVVLYELLTGEVPFPGDNFVAVAMKHINEPAPSVLERRPDAPLRLAAAIDRALAKQPEDRFPSMGAFAAELERVLDELGSPDGSATAILRSPVVKESRPRPVRAGRRSRLPWLLLLLGLAIAAVVAGVLLLGGSGGKKGSSNGGGGGTVPVTLSAAAGYDPQGDGEEHNADAAKATDGDPATYWQTDHYASAQFGNLKHGVGLLLDAGGTHALKQLTVSSDTPGFTAQVLTVSAPSATGSADSSVHTVGSSTTIPLNGASSRYYVLWITQLPGAGVAHVNEVSAKS